MPATTRFARSPAAFHCSLNLARASGSGRLSVGDARKAATEFSFFLAVPTLIAAGVYSMWKDRDALSFADLPMFGVGFVVSFVSAWLCIRWLIRYVSRNDFVPFAWYRIAFGAIVLLTAWTGIVAWQ